MALEAAVAAFDAFALLPQGVGLLGLMWLLESLIDAAPAHESVEEVLICPLVDGEVACMYVCMYVSF